MLDEKGFTRPTYDDLVEQYATKWRELFGATAQTNSHSVGGILIRILAFFTAQLYQLAEVVYNSQFVDSASGTTLDQLANNVGLTRRAESTAIGSVKFVGKAGFVVPEGTMVQTSDGLYYVTTEEITLKDTGANTYTASGQTFTLQDVNVGVGASDLLYANGAGAKYNRTTPEAASQATPVEDIIYCEVSNLEGGADIESDEALRQRIELANQATPSSPYNGVIAGISQVSGVRSVRVIANDTMQDDATTNTPAKSLHIFVDGGSKDKIGGAIFDTVAAGVATTGEQSVIQTDTAGVQHTVKFDYPTRVPVYVKLTLTTNDDYTTDEEAQIKQLLCDYVNGVGMGKTVYYSYLYKLIYDNVSGLTVADVGIGTSESAIQPQNLAMTNIQTAELTASRVVIAYA